MFLTLMSSITATIIAFLLLFVAWSVSMRTMHSREKSSPFECGFDPNHNARTPFSMRFFLLAIIFIVFDIEIVLLIPLPLILTTSNVLILLLTGGTFILILIIGLIHEWNEGALEWSS